ncbi:MAG: CCA tRNA nucleotidyltransferase [Sulfurimonas sp.]|uniref:CCA tRNA nucleotidyltransferase n=1 Tax=Sulfurimonas sp. TaxID=2022749 RepID=UPI0028CBD770|nr:CCA tRNA nucleotidyltransferase [Sulfurimonas sp.]MDT8338027.1 CCA tRNA nucleotidyltransferase [Sulfurimonas sp.]
MIYYPNKLDTIFEKLKSCGIKPIIVGGYIRDYLAKIESKDIDIEIYGISSFSELQNILKEFGSVNVVGKSFGVCKLYFEEYDLDFSFPRIDNKVQSGHRGFEISIDTTLDFKTATSRRDFTINSVGYDVIERKILDPFGGIKDFENKILKAVNLESFGEDPLRVLRAVQFATRFELKIEDDLFSICKDMVLSGMLNELPKERIFEEIKKLLLYAKKPSRGFELLKEFGSDLYTQNISVIDEVAKQRTTDNQTNIILMLAALCYNFSQKEAQDFIEKITYEKELLQRSLLLVKKCSEIDTLYKSSISDYHIYKLAAELNIDELLILSSSIYFANHNSEIYRAGEEIKKRARELNILNKKLPAILMGRDILELGIEPSPLFSEILNEAYEAQMHGKFKNRKDALLWLKEYLNS